MLTFDEGDFRFNYRSVGVIFNRNQVLLHKSEKDSFWALPGGRVEFMESARDTIKREMQEELGINIGVERLLWIVENFFEYDDKSYHELAFYFLISSPSNSAFYAQTKSFKCIEEGSDLIFQWHQLEALEDIELYPKFLQKSLRSIPQVTQYIVHYG
ncbi:MAG TPA: NUDIX hydrolase [Coleofasciculaceae cyanobacterium]|jgi:ADP-ribose pyrophosphatase YjhB (NUDIX family)